MTKRMLVDATHPEETRVAIVESYRDINRLEDLDYSLKSKPLLKGNIYLAKVARVEPSLQAAFVEYGGNRHGFLSFSEIHPDYFRIPMADRSQDEEDLIDEEGDDVSPLDQEQENAESEVPDDLNDPEESFRDDREFDKPVELMDAPLDEAAPLAADGAATESSTTVALAPGETETAAVPHPLDSPFAQPATIGENDHDVGLITDFGNAAVPSVDSGDAPLPLETAPTTEVAPTEGAERYVRRPQRPRYKIQEVVKRGQVMLVQVVKEERGNKGAALTSFLSLAGRYCVLMPNTDHGGGVSRKITNHQDRRRMKEILDQLEIPEGMAVILRTAGMEQDPPEIQRDLEYLLRLWNTIREQTLQSTAPTLIYEEANLIKRSVRDLHSQDINEILVAGEQGYNRARDFMRTIMPDQVEKIKLYQDPIPLFFRYNVENQIDTLHSPVVQLKSGGYLVINPTEALVSIDVNSGRATRERHIEETAVKTNLEAADEIARQLRLRDLAGLVVIDFIDMEDSRNNTAVERRVKEAMKNDRARLQIGRMSPFGLMELSRQRLRPSLTEINFEKCPHCAGVGLVRSVDSASLSILRVIEEEGIKQRSAEILVHVPTRVALYLLNQKRAALSAIEKRYDMTVMIDNDDTLIPPDYRLERSKNRQGGRVAIAAAVNSDQVLAQAERDMPPLPHRDIHEEEPDTSAETAPAQRTERDGNRSRRGRGDRGPFGRRGRNRPPQNPNPAAPEGDTPEGLVVLPESGEAVGNANTPVAAPSAEGAENAQDGAQRRRRRGRRGGRHRNGGEARDPNERWERRNRDPNASGDQQVLVNAPILPSGPIEIDTTPRDPAYDRRPAPQHEPSSAPAQTSPSPHETVNPPTDRPKGGWWRRFTGQEEV